MYVRVGSDGGSDGGREHLDDLRREPTEDLAEAYRQLDALEQAIPAERLQLLAVLDEREVGREDGTPGTVEWVCETSRLTRAHARDQVETARCARVPARDPLDRRERARSRGISSPPSPSWRRRTTTRIGRSARPGWSPAQLARALRTSRVVTRDEADARHARRGVTWHWDQEHTLRDCAATCPDLPGPDGRPGARADRRAERDARDRTGSTSRTRPAAPTRSSSSRARQLAADDDPGSLVRRRARPGRGDSSTTRSPAPSSAMRTSAWRTRPCAG